MSAYIDLLPDDKKLLSKLLQVEALCLSKQQVNTERHATDPSARAVISAIEHLRHVWLSSAALPVTIHQNTEDLLFKSTILFAAMIDEALPQMKKDKQTVCSFGISATLLQACQRSFVEPKYHSYSYYQPSQDLPPHSVSSVLGQSSLY